MLLARALLMSVALLSWPQAWAASGTPPHASAAGIYSCLDSSGRRITSDRPIADCLDREQRVLNKDGSQRKVLPPRQSPQERLLAEEAARERERQAQVLQAAVRRDQKLMQRYPDEAAHAKAREVALNDVRVAVAQTQKRIKGLEAERKILLAETEFYKNRPMPFKLKAELGASDAMLSAQADIMANHDAETKRVNAKFDAQLARLRQLWAGVAPGALPGAASAP